MLQFATFLSGQNAENEENIFCNCLDWKMFTKWLRTQSCTKTTSHLWGLICRCASQFESTVFFAVACERDLLFISMHTQKPHKFVPLLFLWADRVFSVEWTLQFLSCPMHARTHTGESPGEIRKRELQSQKEGLTLSCRQTFLSH